MILLNGNTITPKNFPNGENVFNYDDFQLYRSNPNFVELKFEKMEDITTLYFIMNLMPKDFGYILIAKYIPFSRFDVDNNEDLFMLKAMAKMINDMNFIEVWVDEPVSPVILGMINNIIPSYSTVDILEMLIKEEKITNPMVIFDWKNYDNYKEKFKNYNIASIYASKNQNDEYVVAFNSFSMNKDEKHDYVFVVPYLTEDGEYGKMIKACIRGFSNIEPNVRINIITGHADTSLITLEEDVKIFTKSFLGQLYDNERLKIVTISKDEKSE